MLKLVGCKRSTNSAFHHFPPLGDQEECQARPVPCELCGERGRADQVEEHMAAKMGSHMLALLRENQSLKNEIQSVTTECRSLKEECRSLKEDTQTLKEESESLKEKVAKLEKLVSVAAESSEGAPLL